MARVLSAAAVLIATAALMTWLSSDARPRPPDATLVAISAVASPTSAAIRETSQASPTSAPRATLPPLSDLRISVLRLGIDLPLASGDVARDVPTTGFPGDTPEHVALVFPGSAPLGSGGNTYVYAHARIGMFLSLWNVRVGDSVLIYDPERQDVALRYSVVRVVPRVDPSDTTWLDPAGPERLTLQTSTGPNPGDPRFIAVAAREASSSPRPATP